MAYAIAAASVDITPGTPCPLAGYAGRTQSWLAVSDRLEANIAVISCGGTPVVFVSADLLYIGAGLRERLERALAHQVAPECLFTSATHTHFAPATDENLPVLGRAFPEYVDTISRRISEAALSLLSSVESGKEVSLTFSKGVADHAAYRRLLVKGFRLRRGLPVWGERWEMRPDLAVPVDETIRVLRAVDSAGVHRAIFWSYACHPVCFPHPTNVSADYPGVVRAHVRRRFGDIPVIFWQGFSGDVRPRALKAPAGRLFGRTSDPAFGAFSETAWKDWSDGLAWRVIDAILASGRPVDGKVAATRSLFSGDLLGQIGRSRTLSVQEIWLAEDFSIYGMSSEPVQAYSDKVQKARAPADVVPVSCLDSVFGYLPTSEIVEQGGYEAVNFSRLYGVRGQFRKDISAFTEANLLAGPSMRAAVRSFNG